MSNSKKKYYALDDTHELVSEGRIRKINSGTNRLTHNFFAKRRGKLQKKTTKTKI